MNRRGIGTVMLTAALLWAGADSLYAQGVQGRWALGGFVAYNSPLFSFGKRFSCSRRGTRPCARLPLAASVGARRAVPLRRTRRQFPGLYPKFVKY